jgi:hypothetical protein
MMMQPTKNSPQTIITNLILFSRFFITIVLSYLHYRIIEDIAPVADSFACCATPSPKLRVENAVSPSGIIHAAKSGTRFRHFNATIEAAIR